MSALAGMGFKGDPKPISPQNLKSNFQLPIQIERDDTQFLHKHKRKKQKLLFKSKEIVIFPINRDENLFSENFALPNK